MAEFYCRICNVRKVQTRDGVCTNCQDPYQIDPVHPSSGDDTSFATFISSDAAEDNTSDEALIMRGKSKRRIMGIDSLNSSSVPVKAERIAQPQPIQAIPVVPPVSSQQSVQQTTASAVNVKKKSPQAEGVIRNVVEGKDPKGFLVRWFRSFSHGLSFPMTDDQLEFQVFSNWATTNNAQGYSADKIIVYGKFQSGKPVQDNTVRVYGKRNKNNAIIAEVIENTTDGTRSELDPHPIPSAVVTFLTLFVFLLIGVFLTTVGSLISTIGASASGVGHSLAGLISTLFSLALWGLVTFYCGSKLIRQLTRSGELSSIIMYAVFSLVALMMLKESICKLF